MSSSSDMKPIVVVLLLSLLFINSLSRKSSAAKPNAEITVMGMVYCDVCFNNSFSRHSFFIPGVEVKIDCQFKATSPSNREDIAFSVNRTTNNLGIYKFDLPSVDELACAEAEMASSCQASLIGSSSSASCNIPGYRTTTDQIVFKSKRSNVCIYGLNALNFRPSKKNLALCSKQ